VSATTPILELERASQTFHTRRGVIRAVDDVSLSVMPGEITCLVGESGSGKTTLGKMVAGLRQPTSGRVLFEGRDIWHGQDADQRRYRRSVQIIHQDPYASLNPVHTIYSTLAAPLIHHDITKGPKATRARVTELLQLVDLTPPEEFIDKYPHQLSGGQRQRIAMARALTVEPRLVVADEAVSMVDVSIRVSLLNTLLRLRNELGVAFVFITHDLGIAKYFAWSGSIAVMYLGRVIEYGLTPALAKDPLHPYTRALLAAIPEPDPDLTRSKRKLLLRSLDIPSLLKLPSGCTFHPRCPLFEEGLCDVYSPALVTIEPAHRAACHVVARERTGAVAV